MTFQKPLQLSSSTITAIITPQMVACLRTLSTSQLNWDLKQELRGLQLKPSIILLP